jgi:hypothetical protein
MQPVAPTERGDALPSGPALPAVVPEEPKTDATDAREAAFRRLINSDLTVASSKGRTLAILIDSSGSAGAITEAISGFLRDDKFHLVAELGDIVPLKAAGYFDEMYAGNRRLLSLAAAISGVDYILLAKASYSFRRQDTIDPEFLTCQLSLKFRLIYRTGIVVASASVTAAGPGFTEALALDRAAENGAKELKEQIAASIGDRRL